MFGIANLSNTAHDLQAVAGLLSVKTALFVSKSISVKRVPSLESLYPTYTCVSIVGAATGVEPRIAPFE